MRNFLRNATLLCVLVLGVILLAAGCTTTSGPAQGIVTGTVTDTANNADPLSGVEVSIGTSTTTTDADGVYTLRDVPVGKKTLTAQKDGYTNYSAEVTVTDGETTTHDFTMSPTAPDTGSVSGTVSYSETGENIGGIVVTVGDLSDTTDAEGNYEINGVAPGDGQAITAADQHVPKYYKDYEGTVDVVSDTTTDHDFAMLPAPGRFVVFTSEATNLDEENSYEPNPEASYFPEQVYCRDIATGKTSLITKNCQDEATEGITAVDDEEDETPGGNDSSWYPDISDDCRYVVFQSSATNLTEDDISDGTKNIFLFDRQQDKMTLITKGANEPADCSSYEPRISANGRYVVFFTDATNLPGITNYMSENVVVRYDIVDKTFLQITPYAGDESDGTAGNSVCPAVSADGRYISFSSNSPNLIPGFATKSQQIFRCDCDAAENKFILVSKSNGAPVPQSVDFKAVRAVEPSHGDSYYTDISADGRIITFDSDAYDIAGDPQEGYSQIYRYDVEHPDDTILVSGTPDQKDMYSYQPTISNDGKHIAFSSLAINFEKGEIITGKVFLFELQDDGSGTMTLVSRSYEGGEANCPAYFALVSPDGSYVVYESSATNLVEDTESEYEQVYISIPGMPELNSIISVDPDGKPGESTSYSPTRYEFPYISG